MNEEYWLKQKLILFFFPRAPEIVWLHANVAWLRKFAFQMPWQSEETPDVGE